MSTTSVTTKPFSISTETITKPSSISTGSSSISGAHIGLIVGAATLVGIIVLVVIALLVINLAKRIMYKHTNVNVLSYQYTHTQAPSLGSPIMITTQQNSDYYPRMFRTPEEWTKIQHTPDGVLMDSAPPAYHAALNLPPPMGQECSGLKPSHSNSTQRIHRSPYPG